MREDIQHHILLAIPLGSPYVKLKDDFAAIGYKVDMVNLAFRIISAVRNKSTNLVILHPSIFKGQEKNILTTFQNVIEKSKIPIALCGNFQDKTILPPEARALLAGHILDGLTPSIMASSLKRIIDNTKNKIKASNATDLQTQEKSPTTNPLLSNTAASDSLLEDKITYHKIIQLVYDRTGIALKSDNTRIRHIFNSFCKTKKLESLKKLYSTITTNSLEMTGFINELTINETYLFRNRNYFQMLQDEIYPQIKNTSGNVKIWSAACSTGEEPYSLAMIALNIFPADKIKIFASDIDSKSIEFAKAGIFPEHRINRTRLRFRKYIGQYFTKHDKNYHISENIKNMVTFKHENIKDCRENNFNMIFCRNVLIYFDRESISYMVKIFEKALQPGGILVLGHSESLRNYNTVLKYKATNKCGIYVLPEDG